jgi:hypothetical protein
MKLPKKNDPQPVEIDGLELKCLHCANDRFYGRRILLNTGWLTLFDLDWLNRRATTFICSDCTMIHWFHGE